MPRKTFYLTDHAKRRMKERDIPNPNGIGVIPATRKAMKLIKQSCPNKRFDNNFVYYNRVINGFRYIYVCIQKEVCKYLVITVFKYEINSN